MPRLPARVDEMVYRNEAQIVQTSDDQSKLVKADRAIRRALRAEAVVQSELRAAERDLCDLHHTMGQRRDELRTENTRLTGVKRG